MWCGMSLVHGVSAHFFLYPHVGSSPLISSSAGIGFSKISTSRAGEGIAWPAGLFATMVSATTATYLYHQSCKGGLDRPEPKRALAPYRLSGVSETREQPRQSDFKPHWVLIDVDTRRAICRARRVCRRILLMLHCGGNRAAGYLTVGTVRTSVCFFQQAK